MAFARALVVVLVLRYGSAFQSVSIPRTAWETGFAEGLRQSLKICAQGGGGSWSVGAMGVAVPSGMLAAEQALRMAVQAAPIGAVSDKKMSAFATRLYEHASWLALRHHIVAAEQRYRESQEVALQVGRTGLATHALSRLGYFLRLRGRTDEARQVLLDAVVLSERLPGSDASSVARYLLGALERQEALTLGDGKALSAADERILATGSLPNKELDDERRRIVDGISYWRSAEASPAKCLDTSNFAHAMLCFGSHLARSVHQMLV